MNIYNLRGFLHRLVQNPGPAIVMDADKREINFLSLFLRTKFPNEDRKAVNSLLIFSSPQLFDCSR